MLSGKDFDEAISRHLRGRDPADINMLRLHLLIKLILMDINMAEFSLNSRVVTGKNMQSLLVISHNR